MSRLVTPARGFRALLATRLIACARASFMAGALASCIAGVDARVEAGEPSVVRLRNESDETICYVMIARPGERALDRLGADEVVLPGEERDFRIDLPLGEARQVRMLDCAERALFVGDVMVDALHGVRVILRVHD